MICFAKPVLTEDLYIVQKEEFSITCITIHKRQTHLLVTGCYVRIMTAWVQFRKTKSLVVSLKGLDAKEN
jgi:hypothetical protein